MKVKNAAKIVLAVGMIGLLGVTTGCYGSQIEDLNKNLTIANEKVALFEQLNTAQAEDLSQLNIDLDNKDLAIDNLNSTVTNLTLTLDEKDQELLDYETVQAEADELEAGYEIDELEISSTFSESMSDELGLFDDEIEFDGEDYDAKESMVISNMGIETGGDFEAKAYMVMPEDSLSYGVEFDNQLNTGLINSKDTLDFSFLSKDVKVVEWNVDEVTFLQSITVPLSEGEAYEFHGMEVKVVAVTDDGARVSVGTMSDFVNEGDIEDINGVQVRVSEITYQAYAGGVHAVELDLGYEIEVQAENGEEYADDSMFNWDISSNYIGIVLNEDIVDLDEDEEFNALAALESFSLPNDFKSVYFAGLEDVDSSEYKFEVETKKGAQYLEVTGDFELGLEDYDKVYVNSTGIYDVDLDLISVSSIEMDNTEFDMVLTGNKVFVNDVMVKLDMSKIKVNSVDVSSEDEDILTTYGMLVENPEDAIDDLKLKMSVPEERVTATVIVR